MDVDGPLSNRTRSFYARIWQALEMAGIPYTIHWGKMIGLSATECRRLYGNAVDNWVAARQTLLSTSDLRHTFSNRFIEELGLVG